MRELFESKQAQRVKNEIDRSISKNMSNAKWLSLFELMREAGVKELRWKFVKEDRIYVQPVPKEINLSAFGLLDILPSPYASFSKIDWLEIPNEEAATFSQLHASLKQFPWRRTESGLRVEGYSWQHVPNPSFNGTPCGAR
jgi:hypothetical protein